MVNPAVSASPVAPAPVASAPASDSSQPHVGCAPRVSGAIEHAPLTIPAPSGSLATSGSPWDAMAAITPDESPAPAAPSSPPPSPSPPPSALPMSPATALDVVDISGDEPLNTLPDAPVDVAPIANAAIVALAMTATSAACAEAAANLDDVQMESPPDVLAVSPVDTRPTMAQLLQQQETICLKLYT